MDKKEIFESNFPLDLGLPKTTKIDQFILENKNMKNFNDYTRFSVLSLVQLAIHQEYFILDDE